jgi:hypothetical protein
MQLLSERLLIKKARMPLNYNYSSPFDPIYGYDVVIIGRRENIPALKGWDEGL